jgi:hypothetical protein
MGRRLTRDPFRQRLHRLCDGRDRANNAAAELSPCLAYVAHELSKNGFLDPISLHQQAGDGVVEQIVNAGFHPVAIHDCFLYPKIGDIVAGPSALTVIWSLAITALVTPLTRHIVVRRTS